LLRLSDCFIGLPSTSSNLTLSSSIISVYRVYTTFLDGFNSNRDCGMATFKGLGGYAMASCLSKTCVTGTRVLLLAEPVGNFD
jgi:hypothetical protein